MKKYKIIWIKCLKAHLNRIMLGDETWQECFTNNDWLGIIFGWLIYIIILVSASPITFIVSIICTIKDIRFAKRQIKADNQTFIDNALKYKRIKELKGEKDDNC